MTFLNPTALFALLAAGIPVIIHFLNLRKRNKIPFSSIEFILRMQKTNIRRIKIKKWILLILRVLIIACLVLAFSRPAIKTNSFFSSGAGTSAVIIIDNSFSMSPVTQTGSYFNVARKAAENLIGTFKNGDEVNILFTCSAGDNEGFTGDFIKAKNQINKEDITDRSIPLITSLEKASALLAASRNVNREIYIFSDFQKSRMLTDNYTASPSFKNLNERITIFYISPAAKKEKNLAVTGLKLESPLAEPGGSISFSAEVSNYSNQPAGGTPVSLFINGRRAAQQGINIAAGETRKIFFETILEETGLLEISAELEEDDILNDNKRFLSLYLPEKITIAAFADNLEDLKYLQIAAESFGSASIDISLKRISELPSVSMDKYDIIIICGAGNGTYNNRLTSYYDEGGSIIIFPGSSTSLPAYNLLSAALNIPQAEKLSAGNSKGSYRSIESADFNHPLLNSLFDKKEKKIVNSPSFYTYFSTREETGKIIFALSGGIPLLSEYNSGRGKILRFSSAPVPAASDFPFSALFAPLIRGCISYLAVKPEGADNLYPGDGIPIPARGSIKAVLPGGEPIFANPPKSGSATKLIFDKTADAGVYKFYSGEKLINFSSLNFNSQESVLEKGAISGFKSLLASLNVKSPVIQINPENDIAGEIEKSRFGTELWGLFFLIALLLAAAELITASVFKNETAELDKLNGTERN